VGENEHGSREGVVDAARLLGLHPVAYLPGPPADEHGARGRRDLREIVRCHEVGESATIPQSIEWPGPAMKPSSDIHLFTTTLPLNSRPPSLGPHRTAGLPEPTPARSQRALTRFRSFRRSGHSGSADPLHPPGVAACHVVTVLRHPLIGVRVQAVTATPRLLPVMVS
jgi:hypothetical protein